MASWAHIEINWTSEVMEVLSLIFSNCCTYTLFHVSSTPYFLPSPVKLHLKLFMALKSSESSDLHLKLTCPFISLHSVLSVFPPKYFDTVVKSWPLGPFEHLSMSTSTLYLWCYKTSSKWLLLPNSATSSGWSRLPGSKDVMTPLCPESYFQTKWSFSCILDLRSFIWNELWFLEDGSLHL